MGGNCDFFYTLQQGEGGFFSTPKAYTHISMQFFLCLAIRLTSVRNTGGGPSSSSIIRAPPFENVVFISERSKFELCGNGHAGTAPQNGCGLRVVILKLGMV